ncbi:MAG: glycosyltransferase family 39 protein [Gemmatimonadaceae bacterium]|nr:glycosyltransferase family 39 protein [Gemmatimonadaceae bacterium]
MATPLHQARTTAEQYALVSPTLAAVVGSIVATLAFWLVVRPSFLSVTPEHFASLNTDYVGQVSALTGGHVGFNVRYPPGFPLLLAGVYHSARFLHLPLGVGVTVFVLTCRGLECTLVYRLARMAWDTGPALVATLLWATYLLPLWLTTYPSPETPFIPALIGGVLVYWRAIQARRHARMLLFGAGVLVGIAMLIRPIALGLGGLLALLLWFFLRDVARGRRLALGALLVAGNLLAVLPWEIWAYQHVGRVIPLSTGGVPSMVDGLTYAVDPQDHRHVHVPADVEALQREILARQDVLRTQSFGTVMSYLREELARRPAAMAKFVALKAASSWYATDSSRYDRFVLLVQAIYLPIILIGTWSAWRRGGWTRRFAILAWGTALWFWAMTILVLSIARYMTPALGLLFALVPGALVDVRRLNLRFRRRALVTTAD